MRGFFPLSAMSPGFCALSREYYGKKLTDKKEFWEGTACAERA
jgi:hypothetical protein